MNVCREASARQIIKEVVNGGYRDMSALQEVDGVFYADDSSTPFEGETTMQLNVGGVWRDWVSETYDKGLKVTAEVTNPLNPVIGEMEYLDGQPWHGKEFTLTYAEREREDIYRGGVLVLSRYIKFNEVIEETIEVEARRYQKSKESGKSWYQSLDPNQEITSEEYEDVFKALTETYGPLTGIK